MTFAQNPLEISKLRDAFRTRQVPKDVSSASSSSITDLEEKSEESSQVAKIGAKYDVLDLTGKWHASQIRDVEGTAVLIHYSVLADKWDEWIDISSERIQPLGTKAGASMPAVVDEKIVSSTMLLREIGNSLSKRVAPRISLQCSEQELALQGLTLITASQN